MLKTQTKRGSPAPFKAKRCWIKRIIFALILFCFVFAPLSTEADTIADKQRQLNDLKKQMAEHQKIIEQKRQEAQTLANEIAIIENQIRETEIALEATRIEISKTNEEISIKEKELVEQKKILNESLRLMYEEKETSLLETLLSSKSFSSVLDRIEYLNVVKSKIDATISRIEAIKKDLEAKKQSLESLKAKQEAQAAFLGSQKASKDQLLAETQGQEALYQQKLATENAKAKQIKSEMQRMENSNQNRRSYYAPPSPFGFQWPVQNASITSRHRNRNPARPNHTGLDMVGPTPIYASAGGRVEYRPYDDDGYGNNILIHHEAGFITRYAHLSSISVLNGVDVSRGEQVAVMGSTGNSTGTHLHFEILTAGCGWYCDYDPEDYLP